MGAHVWAGDIRLKTVIRKAKSPDGVAAMAIIREDWSG